MEKTLDDVESCNCTIIHSDIVEKVKKNLIAEQKSCSLSEFFKVFGDNTRIKIIFLALATVGVATIWEAVFADVGVTIIAILNTMRVLNVGDIK